MCLMLGGGMGSAMEPQFPPTAACKAHKSKIQLVAIIQILYRESGDDAPLGGFFLGSSVTVCSSQVGK